MIVRELIETLNNLPEEQKNLEVRYGIGDSYSYGDETKIYYDTLYSNTAGRKENYIMIDNAW